MFLVQGKGFEPHFNIKKSICSPVGTILVQGKLFVHVFTSKNIDFIGVLCSSRESALRCGMLIQSASNNATNFGIHLLTIN